MRLRHVTFIAGAALAAAAAGRDTALAQPRARPDDATMREIWAAKMRFDSAARAGDARRAASVFAPDAIVVIPGRDTLHGREAIERALATLTAPGLRRTAFYPQRVEPCLDGVYEFGGSYEIDADSGARWPRRGPYAIRWSRDSAGALRVQRVFFTRAEAARVSSRSGCRLQYVSTFRRQRVWVYGLVASLSQWDTNDRVTDALRGSGWGDGRITHPEKPTGCCLGTRDPRGLGSGIGARYVAGSRLGVELGLEAMGTIVPEKAQVRAYRSEAESYLTVTPSLRTAGALVSAGTPYLRVAAGPALLYGSTTVRDDNLRRVFANTFPEPTFVGYAYGDPPTTAKGRVRSGGLLAQIVGTVPLSGRASAELRAQWLRFGETSIPATPRFPGAKVGRDASRSVGVSVGLAL